ncbi:TPA: hypothetical protein NJU29_003895, partial [Acinetobacter baumannii]|nr:hypothetical protein [Acinetobacter baumannii]
LLEISLNWLIEISKPEILDDWKQITNFRDFKLELIKLILISTLSEPSYTEKYLNFLLSHNELSKEIYSHITGFSSIIAQKHPKLLVHLTLKFLLDELPKERIEHEEAVYERKKQY